MLHFRARSLQKFIHTICNEYVPVGPGEGDGDQLQEHGEEADSLGATTKHDLQYLAQDLLKDRDRDRKEEKDRERQRQTQRDRETATANTKNKIY